MPFQLNWPTNACALEGPLGAGCDTGQDRLEGYEVSVFLFVAYQVAFSVIAVGIMPSWVEGKGAKVGKFSNFAI